MAKVIISSFALEMLAGHAEVAKYVGKLDDRDEETHLDERPRFKPPFGKICEEGCLTSEWLCTRYYTIHSKKKKAVLIYKYEAILRPTVIVGCPRCAADIEANIFTDHFKIRRIITDFCHFLICCTFNL